MSEVPEDLLKILESSLDRSYQAIASIHPNSALSTWYFLMAYEDHVRNMLIGLWGEELSLHKIIYSIDRFKYAVRYGLDRIAKTSTDVSPAKVPQRVQGALYSRALELLYAGLDQIDGNALCGAVHTGSVRLSRERGAISYVSTTGRQDARYAAAEMIGPHQTEVMDPSSMFAVWARGAAEPPPVIEKIAGSIRLRNRLVQYKYDPALAAELAETFHGFHWVIPHD